MRTMQEISQLIDLTVQERDSYLQNNKRQGPKFRAKVAKYDQDIREFIEERNAIRRAISSNIFSKGHLSLIRGGLYDQAKAS